MPDVSTKKKAQKYIELEMEKTYNRKRKI